MKKKLALLLAAAMAFTSLPTVAFAKSENSVSNVTSVTEDTELNYPKNIASNGSPDEFSTGSYVYTKTTIPKLSIVSDESLPIEYGSTIRLTLNNAEWLSSQHYLDDRDENLRLVNKDIDVSTSYSNQNIDITKISNKQIELVFNAPSGGGGGNTTTTPNYTEPVIPPSITSGATETEKFTQATTGTWVASDKTKNITIADNKLGEVIDKSSAPNADGAHVVDIKAENGHNPSDAFSMTYDKDTGIASITFDENKLSSGSAAYEDAYATFKFTEVKDTYDSSADGGNGAWDGTETDGNEYVILVSAHDESTTEVPTGSGNAIGDKAVFTIPMLVEATDAGDATVTISSTKGNVTTGTYTFATVGTGSTVTTMADTITLSEGDGWKQLENIIIDEVNVGSLEGIYSLTIKATNNFLLSTQKESSSNDYDDFELRGAGGLTFVPSSWTIENNESNEITIKFESTPIQSRSGTKGTLIIQGLRIYADDDAKFGDFHLTVSGTREKGTKGILTKETVLAGTYKDYVVTMEPEDKDLPVIIAGDRPAYINGRNAHNEESIEALEVLIEEAVEQSWWGRRTTKLEVPDGVEIVAASIKGTSGGSYSEINSATEELSFEDLGASKYKAGIATLKGDRIEFKNIEMDGKASLYVKLYLSVEPGFTGDIDVTLSGGGLDESISATIATAIDPLTITMQQTDIKIGYRNVELNDITLRENKAGAIQKNYANNSSTNNTASLILQVEEKDHLDFDTIGSYDVTSGDIVLDSVKIRSGSIVIEVKTESSTPSTIQLKGLKMSIDRTPPEGYYSLYVGGLAVVQNYEENFPSSTSGDYSYTIGDMHGFFDTEWFELEKAYNVITAAPGSANEFNTFVQMSIGSTSMQVGSEIIQMDAAPYISNGRTMLPVRFVANAFGIADDQIYYDQNTKTVTLVSTNRTVQLTVGKTTITSNGTPIEMDVAAEITDGRTFIPVMWVATALGISAPEWDSSSQTVTFNGEYAVTAGQTSETTTVSNAGADEDTDDDNDDEE